MGLRPGSYTTTRDVGYPTAHYVDVSDGKFTLDGGRVTVFLDSTGCQFGCHRLSNTAMDKLMAEWKSWRDERFKRII